MKAIVPHQFVATAAVVALCLSLSACTRQQERPPGRQIESGNSRSYEEGETRRYRIEIQQKVVARVPNEAPPKESSLSLVLEEKVSAPDGQDPQLRIAVVEATAGGEDAENEKQHALTRTATITATSSGYAFAFPGEALGTDGEVRLADVALLAHILAPAHPTGGDRERAFADTATVPTGWSDRPLSLRGSMNAGKSSIVNDRKVLAMNGSHDADATLSMNVVDNAKEASQGADPILDGYFRRVIVESMGEQANPILPIALIPVAFIDLTTFVIACVFTFGTAPGCEDLDEEEGVIRLRLSGPMKMESKAQLHDSTGLLLTSEGTGSATFKGAIPSPPPGRRLKPSAAKIAGAPIELAFTWTYKESLEGEWPKDSSSLLYYAAAAVAAAGVLILLAVIARRLIRRRSAEA